MGNAHAFLRRKGKQHKTEGARIMELAESLRPQIAEWLGNYKNRDGLPVQPSTVRAVALNTAQSLIKQGAY